MKKLLYALAYIGFGLLAASELGHALFGLKVDFGTIRVGDLRPLPLFLPIIGLFVTSFSSLTIVMFGLQKK